MCHTGAAATFAHDEPCPGKLVERALGGDAGDVEFRGQFLLARDELSGPDLAAEDAVAQDQENLVVERHPGIGIEPDGRAFLTRITPA